MHVVAGWRTGTEPRQTVNPEQARLTLSGKGIADWRDLKAWSDAQTGEAGAGVRYWEAYRNVAGHASCAEMAARQTQAAGDKSAFLSGCQEAKRRLDPRRRAPSERRRLPGGF